MELTTNRYSLNDDATKKNREARVKLGIVRVLAYIFLIFLTFLCLIVLYILFVNATKSHGELQQSFTPWPSTNFFTNLDTAIKATQSVNIISGLWNSFIVAILSAVLTTYFSALTAYGVYAYRFKGRKFVAAFILAIMMIPSQVSSVGFITLAYKLHMTNMLFLLIIPSIAAPSVYFYMLQYLRSTLPLELVEASRMDGSSEFGTFNRIVLPVMKPALAVQMIFSFVASWNNYYMPGLLLKSKSKQTLPIMLGLLRSQQMSQQNYGEVWMVIFVSILPVIVIYLILSKSIVKGVTSGSVKG